MTRDEEIKKAAKEIAQGIEDWELAADIEDAFIEGAWWADAHPNKDNMATAYKVGEAATIAKACEWLDCYIDNYLFIDAENKAGIRWDDFINDFSKAMKGGEE